MQFAGPRTSERPIPASPGRRSFVPLTGGRYSHLEQGARQSWNNGELQSGGVLKADGQLMIRAVVEIPGVGAKCIQRSSRAQAALINEDLGRRCGDAMQINPNGTIRRLKRSAQFLKDHDTPAIGRSMGDVRRLGSAYLIIQADSIVLIKHEGGI